MAKSKGSRIGVNLKCTICDSQNNKLDISNYKDTRSLVFNKNIYRTTKNRKNNPSRLELKKFCRVCNQHSIYKETK